MPPVIGLTYLCNSDMLLSFWLFRLIAILKEGVMARLGVSIGYSSATNATIGQPKSEFIMLESHGAMVFLAVWSVWIARHHLRHVWQAARTGVPGPGDNGVMPYRVALLGFSLVTLYLLGCFLAMGLTPWMAVCQLGLMYIAYFTLAKFTAATGFAYLFPVAEKGGNVILSLGGTRGMTAKEIVGMGTINSYAFFGRQRIPACPASLPEAFRVRPKTPLDSVDGDPRFFSDVHRLLSVDHLPRLRTRRAESRVERACQGQSGYLPQDGLCRDRHGSDGV